MKIKIKVTKEHIEKGQRVSPYCCPIALSIREQFPNKRIVVTRAYTLIGARDFKNPSEAQEFIDDFDHRNAVSPFEFELGVAL